MFASLRNWPAGELGTLPKDFWRSCFISVPRETFGQVKTFCVFLGHSRSGHSVFASVLDAHRNIVLADEVRALKYIAAGFSPNAVYKLILRNSMDISSKGRERAGYQFAIPGQWQGKHETIRAIGDKDGSWTATLAVRNFKIIEALYARIPADIRIIHLYRNPYDVISTIFRRYQAAGNRGAIQHAIDYYFRRAEGVELVRRYADPQGVLDLSLEELIARPSSWMERTCSFLSVDAPRDYLDACAKVIFPSQKRSRHDVTWSASDIAQVLERKARYDYLETYTIDE